MLSIEEIRERMKDRNLAEMAKSVKMTRSYLQAVRSGRFDPGAMKQEVISRYLMSEVELEIVEMAGTFIELLDRNKDEIPLEMANEMKEGLKELLEVLQ